ncbi:MAG: glycosyltransferase family 39 protein [Patescibacteria group bacterium]|nr:glycosyltransferase family 39 protein [Patescibacteria group bacterium]
MLEFLFTRTPLRYMVDSFWRDEAFTWLLAKQNLPGILNTTAQDFNPPFYYVIIHNWMNIFGTSEVAIRSFSLLMYCVGCFAVYEHFKNILKTSHRRAIVYTLLLILNPLVLYYAFEGRMYSTLFALAMVSSYFFLTGKNRAYLAVTVAGLWTHLFMGLVVVTQILFYLIEHNLWKKSSKKQETVRLPYMLGSIALVIPWLIFFLSQNRAVQNGFWVSYLQLGDYILLPGYLFTGIYKDYWAPVFQVATLRQYLYLTSLLFTLIAGVALTLRAQSMQVLRVRRYYLYLAFIPIAAVVFVSFFQPLFVPRYLVMASAALSVLAILILHDLSRPWQLVFGLIVAAVAIQGQLFQLEYRDKGSMRELSFELRQLMNESTVIYVESELDLIEAQYYFGENRVYLYGVQYETIPHYVGKVLIPKSRIRTEVPKFPGRAIIISNVGKRDYRIESTFF